MSNISFSVLVLCALLIAQPAFIQARTPTIEAQGNVGVVFPANSALSTDAEPLSAMVDPLWCLAKRISDGEILPIKSARFVHITGHASYPADVELNNNAYFRLNETGVTSAGKYQCKLHLNDVGEGESFVQGNMFVYMRPVFVNQYESMNLQYVEEKEDFTVVAKPTKTAPLGKAVLNCPVLGYPEPLIKWYKDGELLEESDKIKFIGRERHKYTIEIHDVEQSDEGNYQCIATNVFAPDVLRGAPIVEWQSILEQRLNVSCESCFNSDGHSLNAAGYAWIYPLILILIILIVLVLVIYCCAYCKRRISHSDNYDVAKREKTLRAVEEQRLHDDSDADY